MTVVCYSWVRPRQRFWHLRSLFIARALADFGSLLDVQLHLAVAVFLPSLLLTPMCWR